jgi:hypothetical protein
MDTGTVFFIAFMIAILRPPSSGRDKNSRAKEQARGNSIYSFVAFFMACPNATITFDGSGVSALGPSL